MATSLLDTSDGRPSEPLPDLARATPAALADLARVLASRRDLWSRLLHHDPSGRWYARLAGGRGWEAWLIGWLPGQSTGLHDHGTSSGALVVLDGTITETVPVRRPDGHGLERRVLPGGAVRRFGPGHVHDVAGAGDGPAASLHVYGPALATMTRYALDGTRLRQLGTERAGVDW